MRKLGKSIVAFLQGASVAVDSRQLGEKEIFFALPGERVDGHDYLEEAARKGSHKAVVSEGYRGPSFGLELLRVPDVCVALQRAAQERFRQLTGRVVAVTGSMGKTTTKEFARQLIPGAWVTPGNQNSQIGVPLALLNLRENSCRADPKVVILEMGMTALGHIRQLTSLFPPEIAVVTTLALVHAEALGSLANIVRAKEEIFSAPQTKQALIGCDQVTAPCCSATYSLVNPEATFYLSPEHQVVERGEEVGVLKWPMPAFHHRHSFLGAAAIARAVGEEWGSILSRASLLRPIPGRYSLEEVRGIAVVDDSYNANEVSVCAALTHLPHPAGSGIRIAVLGEMVEHGDAAHRRVAQHALHCVDVLLCIGENTRSMASLWSEMGQRAHWFASIQELGRAVRKLAKSGDVVLLKGSRPSRLERVLTMLATP